MESKGIFSVGCLMVAILMVMGSLMPLSMSTEPTDTTQITKIQMVYNIDPGVLAAMEDDDFTVMETYDSFTLVELSEEKAELLENYGYEVADMADRTMISVPGYEFDTTVGTPSVPPELRARESVPGVEGLYIVQMTGPVKVEWLSAMTRTGAEIIGYVDNFAYEVRMTPEICQAVQALDCAGWIGNYEPAYKISPALAGPEVTVTFEGTDIPAEDIDLVRSEITVRKEGSTSSGYIIHGTLLSEGSLPAIAASPYVQFIEPYIEAELSDEMGSQMTGGYAWVNDPDNNLNTPYRTLGNHGAYINQLGWDGSGVTVAIVDTGLGDGTTPNAGHVDFTGRVIGGYDFGTGGWKDEHAHGTHCCGLMAADGYEGSGLKYPGFGPYYNAMGMAHEAQIYAIQVFEGPTGTNVFPADYGLIIGQGYTGGAKVQSNSWNAPTDGAYGASDVAYDTRIRDADPVAAGNQQTIAVFSAGNEGPSTGSVGSPGNAKNVITVGSCLNYMPDASSYGFLGTNPTNPNTISSFSSRGWSDGGRIKPDVCAPGEGTLSTRSPLATQQMWGWYTPDVRYQWCSGTSQACPTVAGGAAAIYQWYQTTYGAAPTPAMTKALIVNSAVDIGTADIPNQNEGWGRMYLPPVVNPASNWVIKDSQPELTTGTYKEYIIQYVNSGLPMKVTLAYTDKNALSGDATPLVNNLDLRLTSPTGLVFHGNAFTGGATPAGTNPIATFDPNADGWDETNNVECVYIPAAQLQTGWYTLRITGFNVPGDCDNDGSNDQDYSLVVYNAVEPAAAKATGPLGASNNAAVTLTYTWIGLPTSVNLYYTKTGGTSWSLAGNDASVDGSYAYTITSGTGTYGWLASAVGGSTSDPSPPPAGTSPEAASLIYDLTPPTPPSGLTVQRYGEGVSGGTSVLTTAGTTQAGGPHNVWFALVDSNAASELTTPNSVAEFTDAYYTAASSSNDVRAGPSSTPGVGVEEFVKCQFATAVNPASVTDITLTFEGYFSAALTGTMYAWNGVTSTWDAIGATHSFLTTDTTMTRSITTTPGNYVSGGYVLWGVYAGTSRRSATVDYLEVSISNAIPYTTYDDNTLNWTASASGDVGHYNIYRSDLQTGTYTLIGESPVGTNTYQDDGKGAADSTYWWYRVRTVDAAGNEELNTVSVQEPAPFTNPPYAINLAGKSANNWVFVSFPSMLSGSIQTILNDATAGDGGTTWTVAKWFNKQTPNDPWKSYRVGGTANDMPTITNTMGVWLYLTANGGDQKLTLNSYAANSSSAVNINLYTGWNMVGYPSATSRLGSATLPAQADRVSVWQAANPYISDLVPGAVTMSAGNAYLVRVTADCVWSVAP